jgi:hypothetical protein
MKMKRIYSRFLEVSIDNGETWDFAGFFENLYCYIEEADKYKPETFTTYEELIEGLESWNIAYLEKETLFKKRKYILIKVPFETLRVWEPKNVQIRIKYKDENNVNIKELMRDLSNQHFAEWVKDKELEFLEKRA